jgi:hypothetical protein
MEWNDLLTKRYDKIDNKIVITPFCNGMIVLVCVLKYRIPQIGKTYQ